MIEILSPTLGIQRFNGPTVHAFEVPRDSMNVLWLAFGVPQRGRRRSFRPTLGIQRSTRSWPTAHRPPSTVHRPCFMVHGSWSRRSWSRRSWSRRSMNVLWLAFGVPRWGRRRSFRPTLGIQRFNGSNGPPTGPPPTVHRPPSMVQGSWFMVHGSWFMVHGSWFMRSMDVLWLAFGVPRWGTAYQPRV